mmetsp:Transcript_21184/g.29678  ORF Transcript_21184/g.29678 Transcript_21184/m.29678 type:complete len:201 (-) Transcript_21184:472-1074(-)
MIFTKTKNSSTADGYACVSYIGNGIESILVGTRGDDIGIMLGTCVQIMIVGTQSGLLELTCLIGIEHSQGTADLESHGIHTLDHIENVIEGILLVSQFTPGSSHAETRGSRLLGALGGLQDLLDLHGGRGFHKGFVTRGLGAIRTVFGAASRFDGEKRALLHLRGIPVHAMHGRGAMHQLVKWKIVNLGNFRFGPIVTHG